MYHVYIFIAMIRRAHRFSRFNFCFIFLWSIWVKIYFIAKTMTQASASVRLRSQFRDNIVYFHVEHSLSSYYTFEKQKMSSNLFYMQKNSRKLHRSLESEIFPFALIRKGLIITNRWHQSSTASPNKKVAFYNGNSQCVTDFIK